MVLSVVCNDRLFLFKRGEIRRIIGDRQLGAGPMFPRAQLKMVDAADRTALRRVEPQIYPLDPLAAGPSLRDSPDRG
jgi:hypothetical protein